MSARKPRPHVLLVDDDEDILEMVRLLLEDHGYDVATAANGREGLAEVALRVPDLILLDMKMPVMDGATFASELRRRCREAPPIVVLTAADDARKRALDIAAAGWIAKPFDLSDLVTAIDAHLRPPAVGRLADAT